MKTKKHVGQRGDAAESRSIKAPQSSVLATASDGG